VPFDAHGLQEIQAETDHELLKHGFERDFLGKGTEFVLAVEEQKITSKETLHNTMSA
jgi:hypothetical protein